MENRGTEKVDTEAVRDDSYHVKRNYTIAGDHLRLLQCNITF